MKDSSKNKKGLISPREKLLSLSMQSTRKSYYPLLQKQLKASQENEQRLNLLINSLPARLAYISSDEKYLLVNNQYHPMFGMVQKEILGKHVETVIGSENYRRAKPFIQKALAGNQVQFEIELVSTDGTEIWSEMTYVPDVHPVRGVLGFYVLAIDLTEKKRAEQEKQMLVQKLQQAQKLESLGTLAGGIAHDFNNLLSPLLGYAELLRDDLPKNSPLQEYVSTILLAAYRSKELVKQILTFSRSTTSEIKPIQMQSMIKEVMKLLRSSIPTSIVINENIDQSCGIVLADPTQIHQIVMNLATNAFHAMEREGGTLSVSLEPILVSENYELLPVNLKHGSYIRLSISDTGEGIPQDMLDKVFDPYFTTKAKGKGTGLGLAVVQGIVQNCNGDVQITSIPGRGTTVSVFFPMEEPQKIAKTEIEDQPVQGGSERILLVDDDESVIKLLHKILYRLGYKVTPMMNSVKALERIKTTPYKFDLIITDMFMPGLTGTQFIRRVRDIRPGIPIIIITGYSDQIDIDTCRSLGVHDYIIKPVRIRELAEIVRRTLA